MRLLCTHRFEGIYIFVIEAINISVYTFSIFFIINHHCNNGCLTLVCKRIDNVFTHISV